MNLIPLEKQFVNTNVFTEIFKKIENPIKFFVDIGASDGISYDPTYCLSKNKWNGISFEASNEKFGALYANLHDGVTKINECVTPDNIVEFLENENAPKDMGAFSIDIDSYDYFVLRKLLENGYSFQSLCVECNTIFPPGINWTVLYKHAKQYWTGNSHFLGCSLSLYDKLLKKYGYEIVCYDWENAYYVKKEYFNSFNISDNSLGHMWHYGYWGRPGRGDPDFFNWNDDFRIASLAPHLQLHFIRNHIHIRIHKENVDFLLFHDTEYNDKHTELLGLGSQI